MENKTNQSENSSSDTTKSTVSRGQDITDSPRDQKKLEPENATIDLPDVKDIPGQEHVRPAPMGEMSDITIASDDEEGVGIFDDEEDDEDTEIDNDNTSNVSSQEKKDLEQTDENMPTKDDQTIVDASLDDEDNEGEPLNEKGFGEDVSGEDLDIPGTDADNANEEIGEEDEENNAYSAGDENNNNVSGNS